MAADQIEALDAINFEEFTPEVGAELQGLVEHQEVLDARAAIFGRHVEESRSKGDASHDGAHCTETHAPQTQPSLRR